MVRKIHILLVLFACCLQAASGHTWTHLKMVSELAEQNKNSLDYDFGRGVQITDPDSEVFDTIKALWGVGDLGDLVLSVYQLMQERDEAIFFLSQIKDLASEKDVDKSVDFSKFLAEGLSIEDTEERKKFMQQFESLFDALDRDTTAVGGIIPRTFRCVPSEVAGAMIKLKQEWGE